MKDRKFHNKELHDNYPPPGVPADEAWSAMSSMLDAGLQQPPPSPGGPKIPGGSNFFMFSALLITAVTLILLLNHGTKKSVKTAGKILSPGTATENATPMKAGSTNSINDAVIKSKTGDTNYGKLSTIERSGKQTLADSTGIKEENAGGKKGSLLHSDTLAYREANTINIPENNSNTTAKDTRSKNFTKDNKANSITRIQHTTSANHVAGFVAVKLVKRGKTFTADKDKKSIDSKNHAAVAGRQQYNVTGGRQASVNEGQESKIQPIETLELTAATSSLATFLASRAQLSLDSSYLQKLRNSLKNRASSKKAKIKSAGHANDTNKKTTTIIEYGFQWDVAVPVQGTTNYFTGTNGNSKPYSQLVPHVWFSKSLTPKSKIFLTLNFNQQYFINNRELTEHLSFASPRDTGLNKITLYKTGGFGAALAYSHKIYRGMSAAFGINYTLNRTALVNKQSINVIAGTKISDSLYGINRHSVDWQYINKSMLLANLELYYAFKKFNLGAAVYLPLSTVPVYGNKNIHPVNAQLFVRWNIRQD